MTVFFLQVISTATIFRLQGDMFPFDGLGKARVLVGEVSNGVVRRRRTRLQAKLPNF